MLRFTFEAMEFIAAPGRYPGERPLRFAAGDGGAFELSPGAKLPSDLSHSHLGTLLLVVDSDLAARLDGKELALVQTTAGKSLVLRERMGPRTSS